MPWNGFAQGLAGIPLFSGIEYRIFCWIVINMIGFSIAPANPNPAATKTMQTPVMES